MSYVGATKSSPEAIALFNSALMVVDPGRIVTVAVAFFVASPVDVAVTVTVAGMGTLEGAVYLPVESIVPQVAPEQQKSRSNSCETLIARSAN